MSANINSAAPTAYTEEQAKAYDNERFVSKAGAEMHRIELKRLLRALGYVQPGASVLEVGCGTGRLLVECARRGYSVTGADASPDMLTELKSKLTDEALCANLYLAEAAKLPVATGSFDFVYAIRLLNQTESPAYALSAVREMIRAAKPGGHILVECVNARRPRVGRNSIATTRLTSSEIAAAARNWGAMSLYVEGAFFLGMGTLLQLGERAVPVVSWTDSRLSRRFPDLCARVYVLLKKQTKAKLYDA